MSVSADRLDANPWLLNTVNGTLDLHTLELYPARPVDYLTKVTTAAYDPAASAPRFQAFLERILPNAEVRSYVQRLFGYGLLGLVREHVMPIFTGSGGNGKSTLIEGGLEATLGDYYVAASPRLLMADQSRSGSATPDVMQLRGARVVTMMETEQGRALDAPKVKHLTGGDTISARQLYQPQVNFIPTHLPIMITNHLPDVPAEDPALWRRLAVVPFDEVIPEGERDVALKETLALEIEGILAWMVAGLSDYQTQGGLAPPEAVSLRTEKYRRDYDNIAAWIEDRCTVDGQNSSRASQSLLWESWEGWARNAKVESGKRSSFLESLGKVPGVSEKRTQTAREMRGIRLGRNEPTFPSIGHLIT